MGKNLNQERKILNPDALLGNLKGYVRQKVMYGYCIAQPPFGYRWKNDANVNNRNLHEDRKPIEDRTYMDIIVDESEAKFVRRVFELYSTTLLTIRQVRDTVNKEFNFLMSKGSFHKMLTNQFYIGFMTIKGNQYKHRAQHIIDEKLFFDVQILLKEKAHRKSAHLVDYFYSKVIKCYTCGSNLTGQTSSKGKSNLVYYRCNETYGKHNSLYIKKEEFDTQIAAELSKISHCFDSYQNESFGGIIKCLKKIHASFIADPKQSITALNALFSSITVDSRTLIFKYNRIIDTIVNDTDYIEYRFSKISKGHHESAVYLQEINDYLKEIATDTIKTVFKDSLAKKDIELDDNSFDLLNIIQKPMHINDILSKVGGNLDALQQTLIGLQLEGKIDESSPGVWERI